MTEKAAEKMMKKEQPKATEAREKMDLTNLVDRTTERIAFLKKQQEDLQKQKADLEILNQQRKELDGAKREIITSLERAIAVLKDEESELQRKHSLVEAIQSEFQKMLKAIRGVREESWQMENIKVELSNALALVARAKKDYLIARGKIEALTSPAVEPDRKAGSVETTPTVRSFLSEPGRLLKYGFLFFLPAALLAFLLMLLFRLISYL